MESNEVSYPVYLPGSVIGIFSNALKLNATVNLIYLKGGHTVDEKLLDKLADKRFHLPHDYDAGLHAIAEKLSHGRSNSRALLIDEVKKDVSKQFSEQVKTLTEQLSKRNEEFQKLQESSVKQLQDTQNNFTEQEKQQNGEMDSYKKEIAALHEKNMQSAINEKIASMKVRLETLSQDNIRLN